MLSPLRTCVAFLTLSMMIFGASIFATLSAAEREANPIDIGGRRELFVDPFLIGELTGGVRQVTIQPKPQEVVLTAGKPWEGNTSAYFTIFRDGDLFRMYYRGSHWDEKKKVGTHPEVTCYAESRDGIHWTRPNLGLYEFAGSMQNNIVWNGIGTHCFTPFKDANPNCSADAKYKALSRGRPQAKKGLYAFKSADGIHWSLMRKEPVITTGAFDSQNLAFWDPHEKVYREYHRHFVKGVRDIMTGTSKDFINWTKPVFLNYFDAPREHLYTNAIRSYDRAPHLLIGFPTRYLPKQGSRVEPVVMISRDRKNFVRRPEPVVPESAPQDRRGNRSNYMVNGLLELPGKPGEYSVYATEAYYTGPDNRVRRFTYRLDGFVALRSDAQPGRLVTKPLRFTGDALELNLLTKAKGSVKVGLQTAAGKPIPGFGLEECQPLNGDHLAGRVQWVGGSLKDLSQKTVRLVMEIHHADVYSLQFVSTSK